MWNLCRIASLALVLVLCVDSSIAETLKQAFIWGVNTNLTKITSNGLAACSSVPIYIGPLAGSSSLGTPPYTMFAFSVGGVPTTQVIGSGPNNLTWTVDHFPGSTLMLSVVDSKNNTGGVDTSLYFVTDGPSTCQPKQSDQSSLPSISANVTNQLETCQPWGLTIANGTGPYTVWLPNLNSDDLTTIEMDAGNNVLVYPNEVPPGLQLMASVSDSTGAWGTSSAVVKTVGSNDTTCPGSKITQTQSQNDNSTGTPQPTQSSSAGHSLNIGLIVGVAVGGTLFVCIIVALGVWFWRRRRQRKDGRGLWETPYVTVYAREDPGPPSPGGPVIREAHSLPLLGASRPGTLYNSSSSATMSEPLPGTPLPTSSGMFSADTESFPGVIIQHLDGGSSEVQELPPPYIDRGGANQRPQPSASGK